MRRLFRSLSPRILLTISGFFLGVPALLLARWANPANMGWHLASLPRGTKQAVCLRRAKVARQVHPETLRLAVRGPVAAIAFRGFRTRGALAPLVLFLSGAVGCGEVNEGVRE